MRSVRGFSLVELMVAVGVIAVLSALVAPRISDGVRRANAPVEVARAHAFLEEARNLARRQNRCIKVVRTDLTSMTMSGVQTCDRTSGGLSDCTGAWTDCPVSTVTAPDKTVSLNGTLVNVTAFGGTTAVPSALSSVTDADTVLFLPNGSTPYANVVTVLLSDLTRGRDRTIRVLPAAGVVRLDD